jgi:radical SAM superfamily enzyme YgiQ (UPF0313 family)
VTIDTHSPYAVAERLISEWFPDRRIRRVLLVTPPDAESELFRLPTARRRRYPNYPPYGLGVIATHLRGIGIEPRVLNLNHEVLKAAHACGVDADFDFDAIWAAALASAVDQFKPDLIGVTCMFTMTHTSLKRVCTAAATHGVPVAIGGVHVTNDVERILDDIPAVHVAFLQEGEVALKDFCRVVNQEAEVASLSQVIFNGAERIRFSNSSRPTEDDMNVIPAYDLLEVSELSSFGVTGNFYGLVPKGTRFATALSTRGCRAQCTFCSVRNFNGRNVRQRTVDSVLDELSMLRNQYGIGHFVWLDDDLLYDHGRAMALFNGMVRRNLNMTWDATNGVIAASCKEDLVAAMAASGCIALNIGVESGNPEILKQVKKPGAVRHFVAAAEILRRYPQIHARAFLMIGFPGETLAMINDTINLSRQMDLDWCGITVLQPLPNTPIYDSMVEQGLIQAVGSSEVRFNAGGYGKQDEIDLGIRMASRNFEDAFCSIGMQDIPTGEQLNDIWFYMNYHLNFHRLFSEDRPLKIHQQVKNLSSLSDVISPEHGFALYFMGYLQHKVEGRIDGALIERLRQKLAASEYWRGRFAAFGLAVTDLETANFRNKDIPRLLPGQMPVDSRSFEDLGLLGTADSYLD